MPNQHAGMMPTLPGLMAATRLLKTRQWSAPTVQANGEGQIPSPKPVATARA
jgi:hypothetical protein